MRADALFARSNQVSVKNRKSRLYAQIRSLIKKDLLNKDLIFKRANLTVLI